MSSDRRTFLRWLGVIGAGGLAGCSAVTGGPTRTKTTASGDDTSGDEAGTSTTTKTPTATLSPTPTSTPTPTPTPTPDPVEGLQTGKLTATDGDSDDFFGSSVAVSRDGQTAIIGAWGDEDPNGPRSGSAYVFERTSNSWRQQAKLTPDDGDSKDWFSRAGSVAVSGDGQTAIIGAWGDEDPNGVGAGSAYVFARTSDTWRQRAKLTPADGDSDDFFGWSVAVSGDGQTAIIGANRDEDPNGFHAGTAYVFRLTSDTWRQQAKLTPDDGDEDDFLVASDNRSDFTSVSCDRHAASYHVVS